MLEPVGKDYIWGGTRLKTEYGKNIDMTPLAETWECSTHSDGPSRIVNGEFAGRTLDVVLREHPEFLGKRVKSADGLPILIKLIDAAQDLSVQVHPDDEYAREHEGLNGKTELWCVIDAQPDASIVCGFAHPVTRELLGTAIETGNFAKHLQRVPVHKGDVFFIPAGTIHSIGAGVIIAEIQENSNVTYRVYDYDRIDKYGQKRLLSYEKALDVLDMQPANQARQKPKLIKCRPGGSGEILCRCRYFTVERIRVSDEYTFYISDDSFQVLLCEEGTGSVKLNRDTEELDLSKGKCVFLTANTGECHVIGNNSVFRVYCE